MRNNTYQYKKSQVSTSHRASGPCSSGTADQGLEVRGSSEADSLLYLYSNNSAEKISKTPLEVSDLALQTANLLTNYHRKQAHTLAVNVDRIFSLVPSINHVEFLTLTFAENLTDFKVASKRFDSLRKHLLNENENFGIWLRSTERQGRGAIHYHLIIETKEDIRTGFDWDLYGLALQARKYGLPYRAFEKKAFATANPALKALWKLLRESMSLYGFGRSEILPVRSNAQAMSYYVGKYISKHIGAREKRDKGMRLITYSHGWIKNSIKFSWYNENSIKWRRNVQKWLDYNFGENQNHEYMDFQLKLRFGKRWVWKYRDDIFNIDEIVNEGNNQIPF